MKLLTSLLLFVLLAHGQAVNTQKTPAWIKITPPGERFQFLMPQQPKVEATEIRYSSRSGPATATGTAYSTSFEDSIYLLWSLETLRAPSNQVDEISTYLDEYADLVWESLFKRARDALPESTVPMAQVGYESELSMGVIPGRQYTFRLGHTVGTTRIYMDGSRLYVLVVLDHGGRSAWRASTSFFSGFQAKSPTKTPFLPVAATFEAEPGQVFKPGETTTMAKVLSKPEPLYTEAARKYGVTGTVVLRGVVSTAGRIESIQIVKRLPHGLTQASVAAAKRIRFRPATKDRRTVLQSIQLEYNFNVY